MGTTREVKVMLRFNHKPYALGASTIRTVVYLLIQSKYSHLLKVINVDAKHLIVEKDPSDDDHSIISFSFVTTDDALDLNAKVEECRLLVQDTVSVEVEIFGLEEVQITQTIEEFDIAGK